MTRLSMSLKNQMRKKRRSQVDGQIIKTVKSRDEVTLMGFGTFKSAKREARVGRNPATGAELKIPALIQPKFVAGKLFKDALNTK